MRRRHALTCSLGPHGSSAFNEEVVNVNHAVVERRGQHAVEIGLVALVLVFCFGGGGRCARSPTWASCVHRAGPSTSTWIPTPSGRTSPTPPWLLGPSNWASPARWVVARPLVPRDLVSELDDALHGPAAARVKVEPQHDGRGCNSVGLEVAQERKHMLAGSAWPHRLH